MALWRLQQHVVLPDPTCPITQSRAAEGPGTACGCGHDHSAADALASSSSSSSGNSGQEQRQFVRYWVHNGEFGIDPDCTFIGTYVAGNDAAHTVSRSQRMLSCDPPRFAGFVNVHSEKMSKSLGNFFTIREASSSNSTCGLEVAQKTCSSSSTLRYLRSPILTFPPVSTCFLGGGALPPPCAALVPLEHPVRALGAHCSIGIPLALLLPGPFTFSLM